MKYLPIIGLEVHLELQTKSKMFCGCDTNIFQAEPNTHVCPVCFGLPGALPIPNQQACEDCLKIGLALRCTLNEHAVFARKHYSYPDLAKGYQISQYELPFAVGGQVTLSNGKVIRVTRAHMEEDTGKLVHGTQQGKDVSFVDFNRCGMPLVEIVSEPDIRSAEEAEEYGRALQQLMQYLGVSEASMEKGLMRFEANISLLATDSNRHPEPSEGSPNDHQYIDPKDLPAYKVEVKNLNSFKALRGAIEYEIKRHTEMLDKGETPAQQTLGWDDAKGKTYSQREKENAHDYRYFPDPDITPMNWMKTAEVKIRASLPELPWDKKARYQSELGLSAYDAHVLILEKATASFFEQSIAVIPQDQDVKKIVKKISNWLTVEVARIVNESQQTLMETKLQPNALSELVLAVETNRLSNTNAKLVLEELIQNGGEVEQVIQNRGLEQITDNSAVEAAVEKVIAEQAKAVADYKSGKTTVIQFLVGMTMRELHGKGNIETIKQIMQNKLS